MMPIFETVALIAFFLALEFERGPLFWIQTHVAFKFEALQTYSGSVLEFCSFRLRLCSVCEYSFGTLV